MLTRVLLIDGDRASCTLLGEYLGQHGLIVTCAGDGVSGLARGIREPHDVLIIDTAVGRLDGFEVLRGVRRQRSVPIIMLSARQGLEDRIQALETGADDCLQKPFVPRELLARIRATLRRSRLWDCETVVRMEKLSVDVERRTALVLGEPLRLTSMEFDILDVL